MGWGLVLNNGTEGVLGFTGDFWMEKHNFFDIPIISIKMIIGQTHLDLYGTFIKLLSLY